MNAAEILRNCQLKIVRQYRRRVHEAVARGDLASAKFWRVAAGQWAARARWADVRNSKHA